MMSMVSAMLFLALTSPPDPPASAPSFAWALAADAPAYRIAGGKAVVRMVHEGPNYMGILEAYPGVKVPAHMHEKSAELLYILEGAGEMVVDGKRTPVKTGHMIQVPPGVKHSFSIPKKSNGRFVAVQIYAPAGPEQRFKKGQRITAAPANRAQ